MKGYLITKLDNFVSGVPEISDEHPGAAALIRRRRKDASAAVELAFAIFLEWRPASNVQLSRKMLS